MFSVHPVWVHREDKNGKTRRRKSAGDLKYVARGVAVKRAVFPKQLSVEPGPSCRRLWKKFAFHHDGPLQAQRSSSSMTAIDLQGLCVFLHPLCLKWFHLGLLMNPGAHYKFYLFAQEAL